MGKFSWEPSDDINPTDNLSEEGYNPLILDHSQSIRSWPDQDCRSSLSGLCQARPHYAWEPRKWDRLGGIDLRFTAHKYMDTM